MRTGILFSATLFIFLISGTANAQPVLVNQAGYLPDQRKLFYGTEAADSFYVIDAADRSVQFRGALVLVTSHDASTGAATYAGDFTPLTKCGRYRIATGLSDTSYVFAISVDVFEEVYKKSLKGFYYQRCGTLLTTECAGEFARNACHTQDATFHSSTGRSGTLPATGGWHDAGDYGKYVVNAGITVGTLLMAYEMFPAKFHYDDLNIPESGNSVPDILDEARYELAWMLEMQDSTDGGVYFKVTSENFCGFIMPAQDTARRYIYQKSTTATGDFAAVMAMAGRIYSAFDSSFASRCLLAAHRAWNYLATNPAIVPAGGFHNPSGTVSGQYGDRNDSDERLWAAAELFVTTGADSFESYFAANYDEGGTFTSAMGWPDVGDMALLDYLAGKQPNADSSAKSRLLSSLDAYCSSLVDIASNDGLNVTLLPAQYHWGSNGTVMNNAVLLIFGYELTGNKNYYNVALDQLNYILGCNIKNLSYVTGVGSVYPMNPHHRPSGSDDVTEPVPGLLTGGPDRGLDDIMLRAHYTTSTPPAVCYIDDEGSYASNEIAINWNAPLVFVSGYFNESSIATDSR